MQKINTITSRKSRNDHIALLLLLMLSNSRIQTQIAISAVHLLLKSVVVALPKQKRNMRNRI